MNLISTWIEFHIFLMTNLNFGQWWAFACIFVVVSPYDTNNLTKKSFAEPDWDNTVNREFVFKMLSLLFCDKIQWNRKSSKIKLCQSPSIVIIICHKNSNMSFNIILACSCSCSYKYSNIIQNKMRLCAGACRIQNVTGEQSESARSAEKFFVFSSRKHLFSTRNVLQ